MNIETVVNDVKGRLEVVGTRAQGAAEASIETLKLANDVLLNGVQGVVKTQTEAGKALFEAGKASFEKAKTAGLVAVVQNPIEYLPEGKDTIVGAFDETVKIATKTGEELVKVVKTGYETVAAKVAGKTTAKRAKAAGGKRKTTAKKAAAATEQTTAAA
ncbi:MAG: phasin family protein [Gammaproteobacteria bacterium]|nr:phasin family protein [Gammaproteobacteria bacterium]